MIKKILTYLILLILFISYSSIFFNSDHSYLVLISFISVIILWLNVAIDWPSLLLLALLGLIPKVGYLKVIQSSFGSSIFIFLLFSFIASYALERSNIIKKISYLFIESKFAAKKSFNLLLMLSLSCLICGLFISPTVLFMIYLPIFHSIIKLLNLKKGDRLARNLILSIILCCGLSSAMTPIAHVFPLISLSLIKQLLNYDISYLSYMSYAFPIGFITYLISLLYFYYDLKKYKLIIKLNFEKIKLNFDDYKILSIFFLMVSLWILPSLIKNIPSLNPLASQIEKYGTFFPPMIASLLLAIIFQNKKNIFNLNDAFKAIPYNALLLCAATLCVGSLLASNDFTIMDNLKSLLATYLSPNLGSMIILLFTLTAAIMTNFTSNIVTASVLTPIVISVLSAFGDSNIALVASFMGMLASYSFASPSAMPCCAIAIGDGYISAKHLLKLGMLFALCAAFISYLFYFLFRFII